MNKEFSLIAWGANTREGWSRGSGSLERESLIVILAMKEEQETGGRSMISDIEKERVMRTKRASRWRKVFFHRSTWAGFSVSPAPRRVLLLPDDRSRE